MDQVMFIGTKEQFISWVKEAMTAVEEEQDNGLITYPEIKAKYNTGIHNVSRKINEAHLIPSKAYYCGRMRNAITRAEAERLFRKTA